jgi:hypothetical protein
VPDSDRALVSSFAIDKWRTAFATINDDSETRVAGLAEWIRVTTSKSKADLVYYLVTGAGLHVGQNASKGGLFRRGSAVDYFVPRDSIVGSDTDHQRALDFELADGTKVIMFFADAFSQFSDHHLEQHKPADAQLATVAAALGWPLQD